MKWYFWAIIGIALGLGAYFGIKYINKTKKEEKDVALNGNQTSTGIVNEQMLDDTTSDETATTEETPVKGDGEPTKGDITAAKLFSIAN